MKFWIVGSCQAAIVLIAMTAPVAAQTGVRNLHLPAGASTLQSLPQNWTDATAEWFYNVPQGSKLVPYDWFLNLEQPDSTNLFRADEHFAELGYLPRASSAGNPDGLAVGFTKDGNHLGMSCAACHTGVIRSGETAYVIDGAPTTGEFEPLLRRLSAALIQTAAPGAKFNRFADRVLGPGSSTADRVALRTQLQTLSDFRAGYNMRNLPAQPSGAFGPGRVDAIGAIFNEVATVFVQQPGNYTPPDAPVDYPCLWDTPQHDRVQWNGSIPNFEIPALSPATGTPAVGALGRNCGEVIGVFGYVDLTRLGLLGVAGYPSSVAKDNLVQIEDTVRTLWSPQWPVAFGAIDEDDRLAGQELFGEYCAQCHDDSFDRTSPTRMVTAVLSRSGTDPAMARNYATRQGRTGLLEGRYKKVPGFGTFGKTALVSDMLFHVAVQITVGSDTPIEAPNANPKPPGNSNPPPPSAAPRPRDLVYKARPLNGIWSTAPFLHNGSVPNLDELLKKPAQRVQSFHKGSLQYDFDKVGYEDAGPFLFDTTQPGNSNLGHDYGPAFTAEERRQLIAYMKSL